MMDELKDVAAYVGTILLIVGGVNAMLLIPDLAHAVSAWLQGAR